MFGGDGMRIAVTGASGLIGASLVRFWKDRADLIVTAMTRSLSSCRDLCEDVPGLQWIQGDLGSLADCQSLVQGQDAIVHLAHTNAPLTSDRDLVADTRLNLIPTLNLLKAIQDAQTRPRVIYPSSGGAIYGIAANRVPFLEDHPCTPVNSYGIQKLAAEHYIRLCAERNALSAMVLRIANVYGWLVAPARRQGFIGTAIFQALQGQPLRIIGNPGNVRDYLHIDDLCRAIDVCLGQDQGCRVINIGTGIGHSVEQVLEVIEGEYGRPLSRRVENGDQGRYLPDWCVLDRDRARQCLGWEPSIDLRTGIRAMFDSHMNRAPR